MQCPQINPKSLNRFYHLESMDSESDHIIANFSLDDIKYI